MRFAKARLPLVIAFIASLAGCSTLPNDVERDPSRAIAPSTETPLGRVATASVPAGGDERSGFRLIATGEDAFGALHALIADARRSLDLQYYLIKDDPYAHSLLRAARQAAERGVRVRVLVDDLYTAGNDQRIAAYAAHPNIEVRLFNPFSVGRTHLSTRFLGALGDLRRINRRMHNKLFVADNAVAVTGGRNLGAEYYMHGEGTNFLDLDLLVVGPIVSELSETFDNYWNSRYAVPIEEFVEAADVKDMPDPAVVAGPVDDAVLEGARVGASLAREVADGRLALTLAAAELHADLPGKVGRSAPRARGGRLVSGKTIATDVVGLLDRAQKEVTIISPYFVPGERGLQIIRGLVDRGVKVTVLTNSLATTDAAVVHLGYAKYREPLLRMGVEVHELRPEPGSEGAKLSAVGSSKASLHAKVVLIDRKTIFVGSYNLDPRSTLLNTEMGIEIDSEALAAQMLALLERRGEGSRFRLVLAPDGGLRWVTRDDGVERVLDEEPDTRPWLLFALKILAPFAPEQLL